ncbi:LANO_0H08856g1_1 [Lachancea nothofagi CBS 11611]|uniref:LANO_0H08856g1_1 n=1 Tax=Lachancea nothofagi CBS 11611 TaxID=1266666 RepID=A0A1G4KLX5_9SACH|nr:LANO_0H08856g1_1 [Lachancea nothofagi CBS 11611]
MALMGRKPSRRIVAAIVAVGLLWMIRTMLPGLNKPSRKSLTRDIGAQLVSELSARAENKNNEALVPDETCGAYFAALKAAEPLWWNNYRENSESFSDEYEAENLRLILERVRVYETCLAQNALPAQIADLDARMFPFIRLGEFPTFTSGDLQKHYDGGNVPLMGQRDTFKFRYDCEQSWLTNWNRLCLKSSAANSRGIVMSFPDSHVSLAIRLIKVLAHQQNLLPIQVVHKGDLSLESQKQISEALPQGQHLWFVDVSPMLHKTFISDFHTYRNKWLATIFSTFTEIVFIDADAISLLPMKNYFDLPEYKESGTLFFKDRAFAHKFDFPYCVPAWKSLQPTSFETKYLGRKRTIDISLMLSSNPTTEQIIIQTLFVGHQRHHMDSGLLVVHKSKHLMALLTGIFINLAPNLSKCTHGDKESFWLAFLLSGHDYKFHPTIASALGKVNEYNEICSVQLGHTTTTGNLLWFNSGFRVCKFSDGIDYDWDGYKKDELHDKYSSIDDAREYYQSMIKIDSAILPDVFVNPWGGGFTDLCIGYTYCARVTENDGQIVKFSEEEVDRLQEIGSVWMKATDVELTYFNT